ncbi:MAG: xanthine dehydrogenase family protein subunit M [Chloroflexota bacterium]|nr:xanthine dehydrogenase family protein subunit M [Chloroflexota bacterium]
MRPFDYVRPASMDEAISLLGDDGQSRLLAGGTDLLTLMKHEITTPERLIDIKRLPQLDGRIEPSGDGLRIGALATLTQIEDDPFITGTYAALSQAAGLAATPQLRNMATIGGNLLQRPRCWYYRSEHVNCWLKGGNDCPARDGENQQHALFGESPCVAVHPSDLATALLALGASVELTGSGGSRTVTLDEFFVLPEDGRRTENVLGESEIVTAIALPAAPSTMRSTYLKAMDRKVWAFALVGAGVRLVVENGVIADARLALGGVAPIPWRAQRAESVLIGSQPGSELFDRAAQLAVEGAIPLAHNGYKVPLLKSLVRNALQSAIS